MLWYLLRLISKVLDRFVYECIVLVCMPNGVCVCVWVYMTLLFGYLLNVVLLRICDYYICMKCLCTIWKYKWMHCSKAALHFSRFLKKITSRTVPITDFFGKQVKMAPISFSLWLLCLIHTVCIKTMELEVILVVRIVYEKAIMLLLVFTISDSHHME